MIEASPTKECLRDVIELLSGETRTEGRARFNGYYGSAKDFKHLNSYLQDVATRCDPAKKWRADDTWSFLELCCKAVPDDDYEDRELWAAKVFLGFHAPVEVSDSIPNAKRKRDGSAPTLHDVDVKNRTFDTSISYRRAYCAPLFSNGGINPSTFRSDRPSGAIWLVAEALCEALAGAIRETLGGVRATETEIVGGTAALPETSKPSSLLIGSSNGKATVRRVSLGRRIVGDRWSVPRWFHPPKSVFGGICVALVSLLILLPLGTSIIPGMITPGASPSPSMLLVPESTLPPTETRVVTFMPTLSEIINSSRDADELVDATCAPSFSSIRRDALSCAVDMDVRRFLDPCFLISDDRISCPNAMDLLLGTGIVGNQAKVTEHIDAVWSSTEGRVGIDNAEEAAGPWIFLLDKTVGDGLPLTCRAALVATVDFDGPTYNCAVANKFPEILADPSNEIFSSASYIGVGYLNQIVAGDLDRSAEPWTVEVVDPNRNTTERVAVRRAWF